MLWLLGARLLVATTLLGGTLLIRGQESASFSSFTPRLLSLLIASTYAVSLAFAWWLRKGALGSGVIGSQLAWDMFLTTGLVFVTGGASSAGTVLYGITVLMAAIVGSPTTPRRVGALSLGLYLALGIAMSRGWIPGPPDQPLENYRPPTDVTVYALMLNVLGLGLVTVLADNLAVRLGSAGGKLRLVAANARSLAALNEDIIRSMTSGLLTTDLSGTVRSANRVAADLFGVSEKELLGTRLEQLLPAAHQPTPDTGEVIRAEAVACRPNHSRFPVGYSISPLRTADGRRSGSLLVFQDLTEITRLRQAAQRAERLATMGRLSVALAHEIRNPLSSISGSVQLVSQSPQIEPEDRRLLGIVITETERLNALVTNMLELGRPKKPERARTNLEELIDDVVQMAQKGLAATTEVTIKRQTKCSDPVAWVDAGQFRQVLWNLIKNAVQASPKAGHVQVRLLEGQPSGATRSLAVEVEDEGPGVSPAVRERIFDTFYSERKHGIGLGLSLVKQLVSGHSGRVEVGGEPGQGAVFRVTLPAEAPDT